MLKGAVGQRKKDKNENDEVQGEITQMERKERRRQTTGSLEQGGRSLTRNGSHI